jgi:hypothetical protein
MPDQQQPQFSDFLLLAVDSHTRGDNPLVKLVPKLPNDELFKDYLGRFGADILMQLADPSNRSTLHIRHARVDGRVRAEDILDYIAKERPWLGSEPGELLILEAQPVTVYELRSWDKRPFSGDIAQPERPEQGEVQVSESGGVAIGGDGFSDVAASGAIEASSEGISIREAREQVQMRRRSEASVGGATAAEVVVSGGFEPTSYASGGSALYPDYEDDYEGEEEGVF